MKRVLVLALTLLCLSPSMRGTGTEGRFANKNIRTQPRDTLRIIKGVLHGRWYSADYIQDVKRTKSPLISARIASSITEIFLDTSLVKGDSLEVHAQGLHEGGSFMVYFRTGYGFQLPVTHEDIPNDSLRMRISFALQGTDTVLTLTTITSTGKLRGMRRFLRAPIGIEHPLDYLVNQIVMAGEYLATDRAGKQFDISLDSSGAVRGFHRYSTYQVLLDFGGGPAARMDVICFNLQQKNQRCFSFSTRSDTTILYQDLGEDSKGRQRIGVVQYTLVRRK